jgi:phage terminase small subunit
MSTEQKDLIDTEELINNLDEELNEQQKELQNELLKEQQDIQQSEELHDEVKFGSDKEEVENISTELLPPEPQKPNAKKILAKSKEELEEDLKGHELKTGHQRI